MKLLKKIKQELNHFVAFVSEAEYQNVKQKRVIKDIDEYAYLTNMKDLLKNKDYDSIPILKIDMCLSLLPKMKVPKTTKVIVVKGLYNIQDFIDIEVSKEYRKEYPMQVKDVKQESNMIVGFASEEDYQNQIKGEPCVKEEKPFLLFTDLSELLNNEEYDDVEVVDYEFIDAKFDFMENGSETIMVIIVKRPEQIETLINSALENLPKVATTPLA